MRRMLMIIGSPALAISLLTIPSANSAGNQDQPRQRSEKKMQENLVKEVRHQLLLLLLCFRSPERLSFLRQIVL